MTTIPAPMLPLKIRFPTREEWQAMMFSPSVMVTMIVCGTVLALAAIAGVVFLAYTGNDTAVIGTMIVAVLGAVGALINARVKKTLDAVNQQKAQE